MIKAKRKPLEEINNFIKPYKNVLVVGCGGCVSVCLAGGVKEVDVLIAELRILQRREDTYVVMDPYTVERQCNRVFFTELEPKRKTYDAFVSLACGAGAQLLAEAFPEIPVFPGVNTVFIGVDRRIGVYEEKCRACGECVLAYTGGICPVTRCAKGLFNGPCGGTNRGMCEIDPNIPCAWNDIYERLKVQGRVDMIREIRDPMLWKNQTQRAIVQEPFEKRYAEEG